MQRLHRLRSPGCSPSGLTSFPIPGTTKLHRLEENIGAASVKLTDADLREINDGASGLEAEGDRYAPAQMAMVGREAPEKAEAEDRSMTSVTPTVTLNNGVDIGTLGLTI